MESFKSFIAQEIEELTFQKVSSKDPLISSNLLDSITVVDLAVAIEEETGINIPFTDISVNNFDNIDLIIDFLKSKK
ncbi:MAG: phosphopantetheine-binding protein [Bacteroidales bacterium]|jgi:acyl carrier protein|nr:phosphopantetheine-binding protein [Bacteroidales bacterium]